MNGRTGIFAAAAAAWIAAALFFAYSPSPLAWGLSNGADPARALRIAWTLAAPIPLLLFLLLRRTGGGTRRATGGTIPVLLLAAGALLLFFFLRSRNFFHGDGWLLTTFLERDADPIEFRPGWGTIWIHRLLFRVLRDAGVRAAQFYAFALLSALAGAAYVLLAARAARAAAAGLPRDALRGGAFFAGALLLTTGSMQLFFGHVENYSLAHAAILAFLAAGMESARSGKRPVLPFLLFAAAVFFHWQSLILLPPLLFLTALSLRPALHRPLRIVFLAGLALLFPLLPAAAEFGWTGLSHSWTARNTLFPFGILSATHLLFLGNLAALLIPLPLAALLASAFPARPRESRDEPAPVDSFLAVAALASALFAFVYKPFLGPRDWDLFSSAVPAIALFAARLFLRRAKPVSLRPAAAVAAGAGLWLLLPWVAGNADPSATGPRLLRFAADDPHHWYNRRPRALDLATVAAERGQAEASRVLLEKVVRRRPELAVARADMGILLWREGNYAAAKEHLRAAVERDRSLDPPLYYLGTTLFHLNQEDRGESLFREFLERKPGNPSAAGYLGRVLMARGEWAEAKRWLSVAEEALPENADLQAWLARTEIGLGDGEAAARRIERALRIDPDHAEALRLGALEAEGEPAGEETERGARTFARPRPARNPAGM